MSLHPSDKRLDEYAALLIRIGLGLRPGMTLVLSCPVDCAPFARKCAAAAYDAGCREVVMSWRDDALSRMKFLHADDAIFDTTAEWQKQFFNGYAEQGAAYLAGLTSGLWKPDELLFARKIAVRYAPQMDGAEREKRRRDWKRAVERSLQWAKDEE